MYLIHFCTAQATPSPLLWVSTVLAIERLITSHQHATPTIVVSTPVREVNPLLHHTLPRWLATSVLGALNNHHLQCYLQCHYWYFATRSSSSKTPSAPSSVLSTTTGISKPPYKCHLQSHHWHFATRSSPSKTPSAPSSVLSTTTDLQTPLQVSSPVSSLTLCYKIIFI